jgi:hypothetical protein
LSGRAPTFVLFATTVLGGCATTPLDNADARYAQGVASFDAHQWLEARDQLNSFFKDECTRGGHTVAGCQKAVWLRMRSDLNADLPAQAVEDATGYAALGPPREELSPSVAALKFLARARVAARWRSPDRSARVQILYRDEVGGGFHPIGVTCSIDGLQTMPVPEERWITADPIMDITAPAGGHYVEIVSVYTRGLYTLRIVSTKAFEAKANDRVVVVTRIHARPDATPALATIPAVDFDVKPGQTVATAGRP